MPASARSLFVFGCYLLVLGPLLLVAPNLLLSIFRIPPTTEIWIRVVGMLVLFLGTLHVLSARNNLRPYIAWSVPIRLSVSAFFGAFVLLGQAPPILMLFGAVDLAGALWTLGALRAEGAAGKGSSG